MGEQQSRSQRWAKARRLIEWDDEFDGDPAAETAVEDR